MESTDIKRYGSEPLRHIAGTVVNMVRADDGEYVLFADHVTVVTALRQIIDQFAHQGSVDRLIELAIEANDLMYANGVRDEAARHSQPSMYNEGRWDACKRIREGQMKLMGIYVSEGGMIQKDVDDILAIIEEEEKRKP
jgi:hypothetical protein